MLSENKFSFSGLKFSYHIFFRKNAFIFWFDMNTRSRDVRRGFSNFFCFELTNKSWIPKIVQPYGVDGTEAIWIMFRAYFVESF